MPAISQHQPRIEIWSERRAEHPVSGQRVLVVDDYVDAADALSMYLSVNNFDVRTAYGGREALQVALAWRPHSIILDIAMPDLSGIAVAIALRGMPAAAGILLIAYTAQPPETEYSAIRQSGFDAVCAKPAGPDWLVGLLQTMAAPVTTEFPGDQA